MSDRPLEAGTNEVRKASVFISYSRKDKEFVRSMDEALKEQGLKTWIDSKDIPFAGAWQQEIYTAIENTDAFLFIISPDSVISPNCAKESAHAVEHNKRIVPAVYRQVEGSAVPEAIAKYQFLYVTDSALNTSVQSVIEAVETDFDYLHGHTRLLVRALEWDRKKRDSSFVLHGSDLLDAEQWLIKASANRKPRPTQLQTEYIIESRNVATRRQRILLGSIVFGLVIAVSLAALYWSQRNRAINQANIALARQLAAQAELMRNQHPNLLPRATLLAVEAAQRLPQLETDQALRNSLDLLPASIAVLPHNGQVKALTFNSGGKYLVTVDETNVARVWETDTGREVVSLFVNKALGNVFFDQGGKYLAFISEDDNTARVWDLLNKREEMAIEHAAQVNAIGISESATGVLLVSASNNEAKVWRLSDHQQVVALPHKNRVEAIAFSPTGRWLATVAGHEVQIWNSKDWRRDGLIKLDNGIESVVFSGNESALATISQDTVNVWNVPNATQIISIKHGDFIKGVDFSPDSRYLATASVVRTLSDTSARVWDTTTGLEVGRLPQNGQISAVRFSPDGRYLATASGGFYPSDNTARIWDWRNSRELARMAHEDGVITISFSPDGKYLATGSVDGNATIWNVVNPAATFSLKNSGRLVFLEVSQDSKYIAAASRSYDAGGNTVCVWEVETGQIINCLPDFGHVTGIAFGPDSEYLSVADTGSSTFKIVQIKSAQVVSESSYDGEARSVAYGPSGKHHALVSDTIDIFESGRSEPVVRLDTKSSISSMTFSPNELVFAAGSMDGKLWLWDTRTGQQVVSMTQNGDVEAIAFNPDGRYLAAVSWESTTNKIDVSVWSTTNGTRISRFPSDERVLTIAFSPDGKYLITGSMDRTARVWEIETGKEVSRVRSSFPVRKAVFSADGSRLITVSGDGTSEEIVLRTSSWRSHDLISDACSRLNRNLRSDEWQNYLGNEPRRKTCENLPLD